MFLRIRHIIVVLSCVGMVVAPQVLRGESHYRLAKAYADKNDAERASVYYGLALKYAASAQVSGIASDYAAFLLEEGNYHKAELMLRQALSQSPNDEQLVKTLARCLVLQDKVIEGLRYYKSVGSEAEAKEEIMAIYREQGNTDMVAVAKRRWGDAIPEPAYMAAIPKPVLPSTKTVIPGPAVSFTDEKPGTLPKPMVIVHKPVAPKSVVAPKPLVVKTMPGISISKSELFNTKIPIPVPRSAPLSIAKNSPKPVAPVPPPLPAPKKSVARLAKSAPIPVETLLAEILPKQEKRTPAQANQGKLAAAPQPTLSTRYSSTAVVVPRPRKHYIINTSGSADLDALFPVKPVVAVIPAR